MRPHGDPGMIQRRAPRAGYDFEAKANYRLQLYNAVRRHADFRFANANIVIMPSIEGLEIAIAQSYGFARHNIHAVDWNPAIVATLQRRFPGIKTYGVPVEKAMCRIGSQDGMIDFANLDLTGCMSANIRRTLHQIGYSRSLAPIALVAITLLRGRERRDDFQAMALFADIDRAITNLPYGRRVETHGQLAEADHARIHDAFSALSGYDAIQGTVKWSYQLLTCGIYRSAAGNQTMLWGLARLKYPSMKIRQVRRITQRPLRRTAIVREYANQQAMLVRCVLLKTRMFLNGECEQSCAIEGWRMINGSRGLKDMARKLGALPIMESLLADDPVMTGD